MKRERKKENKEKVEELENGRRISGGKKKWWKWRGDEKNLSFDECWPATLVCSQPSQPHYNRLIKSQRVRIPLASIRLRQGFHKNRFLTDSFQSNRGYSRYTKVTGVQRACKRLQLASERPFGLRLEIVRLETHTASMISLSLLYTSPRFSSFPPFPACLIFFPISRNSANFHFQPFIWMERGANSCILTSEHSKSKIP